MILASIALVIVVVLVCLLAPLPWKHTNDQEHIAHIYASIKLPQSLHLKSQRWDNQNAADPALHSEWEYGYIVAKGTDNKQTAQAIETSLQQQGFTVSKGFDTHSSNEFSIDARKSDIWLAIYVGVDVNSSDKYTSAGNDVIITAERPE